jgi:hypothetical protein
VIMHVPENRYGFHFIDTDEFGLFTTFSADASKTYESYYRSDRTFAAAEILDYLRIEDRL